MKEIKEESNHNKSGFNDDSITSEDYNSKQNRISRFLIKSHLTDSSKNLSKNNDSGSINDTKKAKSSSHINLEVIGNDNEIITAISEKNMKSSINSEDEENMKIKNTNNNNFIESNELNTNLLTEEESIFFNFKNKLSKISSTDEIFRDTIKLSMGRLNRFNTSKLAREFTYEEKGECKHYLLKSKKFGMAKNKNLVTYILNLYIFSEFINFSVLEKDNRFKLYFIPKSGVKFMPDTLNALNILKIENNKTEQYINFINGINELLSDKEYNDIQKKNKKFKITLYLSNIILFFLIAGLLFCGYYFHSFFIVKPEKNKEKIIKLSIVISAGLCIILFTILFIIQFVKFCRKELYIKFNYLNYMLMNYSRFNDYIEEWNHNFFENYKIRVSIPISMNYIMFNLDPFQNIEIKHLDMKWFIEKVYKDKKSMANDKEFIKYYIKVRSTLVEGYNNV
jgi:hypothetical protein